MAALVCHVHLPVQRRYACLARTMTYIPDRHIRMFPDDEEPRHHYFQHPGGPSNVPRVHEKVSADEAGARRVGHRQPIISMKLACQRAPGRAALPRAAAARTISLSRPGAYGHLDAAASIYLPRWRRSWPHEVAGGHLDLGRLPLPPLPPAIGGTAVTPCRYTIDTERLSSTQRSGNKMATPGRNLALWILLSALCSAGTAGGERRKWQCSSACSNGGKVDGGGDQTSQTNVLKFLKRKEKLQLALLSKSRP